MKEKAEKADKMDVTIKNNHKFMMKELTKLLDIITDDAEFDEADNVSTYIKENFKMYIDVNKEIDIEKKDYFSYDVLSYIK